MRMRRVVVVPSPQLPPSRAWHTVWVAVLGWSVVLVRSFTLCTLKPCLFIYELYVGGCDGGDDGARHESPGR